MIDHANGRPAVLAERPLPATDPRREEVSNFFGRPGKPKTDVYGWKIKDAPGTFAMIDKSRLNIDHDYQRDKISNVRVLEIVRVWSYMACGCLVVARRKDGTLWVVDGQHRKLAADKRADVTELPCLVFEVDEVAEEAAGFVRTNCVRGPVRGIHQYKALLKSKDEIIVAIDEAVTSRGYAVSSYSSPKTLAFVASLEKQFRADRDVFERMLDLCIYIAGESPLNSSLFEALCYLENFMAKKDLGSLTEKDHVRRLVAVGQAGLVEKIRHCCIYRGKGGPKVGADGIMQVLNHKRRNRLPGPFDSITAD